MIIDRPEWMEKWWDYVKDFIPKALLSSDPQKE